jgi:hypothetical protein
MSRVRTRCHITTERKLVEIAEVYVGQRYCGVLGKLNMAS